MHSLRLLCVGQEDRQGLVAFAQDHQTERKFGGWKGIGDIVTGLFWFIHLFIFSVQFKL